MKNIALCLATVSVLAAVLTGCSTTNAANIATSSAPQDLQRSNSSSQPVPPACGKYPKWLVNDLKLASQVHFPVSCQTYALDWNAPTYANGVKDFNVFTETKRLWVGGYTGTRSEQNYSFYSGPFDMKALYGQATNNAAYPCGHVTSIYMLESGAQFGDAGYLVPAISVELGNGEFLAFAPDEVITKSNHAGMDQYIVYPVQGIKLPN